MPFHQDATCTIRPEGLIAENYIDCDPGSAEQPAAARPRRPSADRAGPEHDRAGQPARPVQHVQPARRASASRCSSTSSGSAPPARGDDFNDILRRANPALALARQAIGILARQKSAAGDDRRRHQHDRRRGRGAHGQRSSGSSTRRRALTTLTAAHRDRALAGDRPAARPARRRPAGAPAARHRGRRRHAARPAAPRRGPVAEPGRHATSGRSSRRPSPGLREARRRAQAGDPGDPRHHAARRARCAATRIARCRARKLFAQLAANLQQHGFVENFLTVVYYDRHLAGPLRRDLAPALDPARRPAERDRAATTRRRRSRAAAPTTASSPPTPPVKRPRRGERPTRRSRSHAASRARSARGTAPAQPERAAPSTTTTTTPAPASPDPAPPRPPGRSRRTQTPPEPRQLPAQMRSGRQDGTRAVRQPDPRRDDHDPRRDRRGVPVLHRRERAAVRADLQRQRRRRQRRRSWSRTPTSGSAARGSARC